MLRLNTYIIYAWFEHGDFIFKIMRSLITASYRRWALPLSIQLNSIPLTASTTQRSSPSNKKANDKRCYNSNTTYMIDNKISAINGATIA